MKDIIKRLLATAKAWVKTVGFIKFLAFMAYSVILYGVSKTPGGGHKGISFLFLLVAYGVALLVIKKASKK